MDSPWIIIAVKTGCTKKEKLHQYIHFFYLGFRHEIGENVVSYWPRNLRQTDYSSQFELFFGQIDNVTPSGYTVVFEDGDIAHDVNPRWVFSKPSKNLFFLIWVKIFLIFYFSSNSASLKHALTREKLMS